MSKILYSRVLLWQQDIDECLSLLKMGERSYESAIRRVRDFPKDQTQHAAWAAMSDDEYHRASGACANICPDEMEFPTRTERWAIYLALEMLAVVTFARVWNEGGQKKGVVDKNTSAAVEALRERMVAFAFPESEGRAAFDDFLHALQMARNTSIAHAHAGPRDVKYFDRFVSFGAASEVMNNIDVEAFQAYATKLQKSARIVLDEAARLPD